MTTKSNTLISTFAQDVFDGLNAPIKRLPSKYFYDEKGDQIFQEIMKMDEYYLTRSEYEILSTHKEAIYHAFSGNEEIQLIELGAGDGFKTKVLLEHFIDQQLNFEYIPIDISASVLKKLCTDLSKRWPALKTSPIVDSYSSALKKIDSAKRKVILFLGSNIGNFNYSQASKFLLEINNCLKENDLLFLGVDLKKHPQIILDAYNDKLGITKSFNLNLLERMNKELGADFDLSQFEHFPTYDPISGETKSFLISLRNQTVRFQEPPFKVHFSYAEPIFMEISKKYDIEELESLAIQTNYTVVNHFYDCKEFFVDSLWKKEYL